MPIPAQCQCGARFAAPDHLAGKSVACPTCKQPLKIPAPAAAAASASKPQQPAKQAAPRQQASKQATPQTAAAKPAAAPAPAGKIAVKCQCGAGFAAPANLAGKRVACPTCKQPVEIPAARQAAAKQPAAAAASRTSQPQRSAAVSTGGISELLDELGVEGKKIGAEYCPECEALYPAEALICVNCGYNRKSGRKLKTVTVKAPPTKMLDLSAPKGGLKMGSSESGGRPERPTGATVLAVIHALGGLLHGLLMVLVVLAAGLIASFLPTEEELPFLLMALVALDMFLIMLVQFFLCFGYWTGKPLAWYLGFSWYVFCAVNSGVEIVQALMMSPEEAGEMGQSIPRLIGRAMGGILLPLSVASSMFKDDWQQFFQIDPASRTTMLAISLAVVGLWTLIEHLVLMAF